MAEENFERQELSDRLSLIESMIAEGRRTTESWGWTFVLWGVAYYVAILWATLGHSNWAWPVTMSAACVVIVSFPVQANQNVRPKRTFPNRLWRFQNIFHCYSLPRNRLRV